MNQMNSKKYGIFLVLTVIGLFVMQTLAARIGSLVAMQFNYAYFDPDDLFFLYVFIILFRQFLH